MTMKKNLTKPVIAVLLGALTFSSCIGSFGLTNSVLDWNKRATDNKFVNEIIFVLISPAYAVCSFLLSKMDLPNGQLPQFS